MAMLNNEMVPSGKRLQKTMERSTMFNGKIHCFNWAIFNILFVCLPEAMVSDDPLFFFVGHP